MKKIIIIGCPASGKTTLATKISTVLHIPVHHLDQFVWRENNIYASQEESIAHVTELVKNNEWIIDGSMPRSKTLDIRIAQADTIIFYDLPILVILWRRFKRYLKYYNKVRPDMGGNNKEAWPFTWKSIQYVYNFPTSTVYSKLEPYKDTKEIIILKNHRDELKLLKDLQNKKGSLLQ